MKVVAQRLLLAAAATYQRHMFADRFGKPKPQFQLRKSWRFERQHRRLAPGHYLWYVWAGYGPRSKQQYGGQIVNSSFTVTR